MISARDVKTYILSGGESRRMGIDKGLAVLAGRPMVSFLLDSFSSMGIVPTIITNQPGYTGMGYRTISDLTPGKGPMGGIYTALQDARSAVLIVSADTPFISDVVINSLLREADQTRISVIMNEGQVYPLCGIFPYELAEILKGNILFNRLRIMDLFSQYPTDYIRLRVDDAIFKNVNTPQDLVAASAYLQKKEQMKKILIFGNLNDIITETIECTFPLTLDEFNARLIEKYPALKNFTYKFAVDKEITSDGNIVLTEQSEIAILPPFSGG